MNRLTTLFFICIAFISPQMALAADVPKEKQTKLEKYLTSAEAHDRLNTSRSTKLFLDTRTRAEVAYVGYPSEIDGHIPYVEVSNFWEWDEKAGRYKLETNGNFAKEIEAELHKRGLTRNDEIILICRSGDRSARAVNLLADSGFTNVYTVVDGFEGDLSKDGRRTVNGWKNANLPWTYKLDKTKIYKPHQN